MLPSFLDFMLNPNRGIQSTEGIRTMQKSPEIRVRENVQKRLAQPVAAEIVE